MSESTRVHGSIFFLLKKFIDRSLPKGSWEKLNESAGNGSMQFDITSNYDISHINNFLQAAAELTGSTSGELMEKFGEELVPDLMSIYSSYLKPEWKTYDVLLYTESVMHGTVRRLNSTANPPVLNVTKTGDDVLMIDYFSKRRMSALALGIIRGIAKFYNESDKINIIPLSDPNDERVQIRVEFGLK
ncbi:MAG: hypothetical protein K0S53_2861 [Bacteroidetes bacterium]|jgi:hypothetical protein|nr:hypothetical protein [Bacteroidota bacterium]MDF2452910.1 hypothetical protein [Bacteroidota bacterium]